ncbi:HD domain-containing protein [Floricoccus penangensis]|uniref:HD domain-containing protein n=1 Tax=Floricoccus penangensis TaxID=1859475 RepID=UPI00218B743B|nr:HD domain-containing protein [Floricoccus penangensis]
MDNPALLNDEKLVKIRDFAYDIHWENNDGHDFNHIRRVAGLAQKILETYSHVDKFTVLATVYLHDCYDQKLFVDSLKQKAKVINFLSKLEIEQDVIDKIIYIIDNMSFSANMDGQKELDLVGQIVQDADRLDSMGAIAINRALEYGWSHNRKLYDPSVKPRHDLSKDEYRNSEGTTINHFYEKLFLLSDKLNTEEARELAEGRDQIMHDFVIGIERDWIEVS